MTEIERAIWAAAFALEHNKEYWFIKNNGLDHSQNREVNGFSCAEIADEAVGKFREALRCVDGEYLEFYQDFMEERK